VVKNYVTSGSAADVEDDNNSDAHSDSSSLRKKLRLEMLGQQAESTPSSPVSDEIQHYLSLRVPTQFEDNPLSFWESYQKTFPILAKVAQVYLGMSSSSVPVECMFSTTGLISNGKRSSISPERMNRVLFIHDNFMLATDNGS
jgi:hypothetical protein